MPIYWYALCTRDRLVKSQSDGGSGTLYDDQHCCFIDGESSDQHFLLSGEVRVPALTEGWEGGGDGPQPPPNAQLPSQQGQQQVQLVSRQQTLNLLQILDPRSLPQHKGPKGTEGLKGPKVPKVSEVTTKLRRQHSATAFLFFSPPYLAQVVHFLDCIVFTVGCST